MTTHATFVGTINYSNRLEKTYTKYVNQSVSFEMTFLEFIEKYYELSERKKFQNLCKFIDKINITINNIQITSENLSHNLNLIDAKTEIIYIVIQVKVERDVIGYHNMKNLLIYLGANNELNVVSENSYNVESIKINKFSLDKNILQQTQFIHLFKKSHTKNINIVLYDMVFFLKNDGTNVEQIYNFCDLIEEEITEFKIHGTEKIKKFIKPSGKYMEINPDFPNRIIAQKYVDKLNSILEDVIDMQITWYILNYRTVVKSDNIIEILKDNDISNDSIMIYSFCG